jgi:hypothetical protein
MPDEDDDRLLIFDEVAKGPRLAITVEDLKERGLKHLERGREADRKQAAGEGGGSPSADAPSTATSPSWPAAFAEQPQLQKRKRTYASVSKSSSSALIRSAFSLRDSLRPRISIDAFSLMPALRLSRRSKASSSSVRSQVDVGGRMPQMDGPPPPVGEHEDMLDRGVWPAYRG